jgi:hypothetical protein
VYAHLLENVQTKVGIETGRLLAGWASLPASTHSRLTEDTRDHRLVTMTARPRSIAAGRFKAGCLALIDDVAATRREIVITKRGKPLARLVPLETGATEPGVGLIEYQGDLVSPVDAEWDASR